MSSHLQPCPQGLGSTELSSPSARILLQPLPAFPCVVFHHSLSPQEESGRVPGLPCVKDGGRGRLPWVFAITAQDPCHSYEVSEDQHWLSSQGKFGSWLLPALVLGREANTHFNAGAEGCHMAQELMKGSSSS